MEQQSTAMMQRSDYPRYGKGLVLMDGEHYREQHDEAEVYEYFRDSTWPYGPPRRYLDYSPKVQLCDWMWLLCK